MSISDAIGQVDRIVQWEQQLTDPAALAQASGSGGVASTGSTGTTGASGASSSVSFAAALAQAQAQGATQATSTLDPTAATAGGTATGSSDARIQAMTAQADALVGRPYVWGGGHDGWGPQSGYDCSGFVSAVLHAGGYLSSPQDTTTLPTAPGIESGPGRYVTIYDRDKPGEDGHVIIEIEGQFYESGGQRGTWGGGGGVERISTPSAAYLSTFDRILHPGGL